MHNSTIIQEGKEDEKPRYAIGCRKRSVCTNHSPKRFSTIENVLLVRSEIKFSNAVTIFNKEGDMNT